MIELLTGDFPQGSVSHGANYFARGLVNIKQLTPTHVSASVIGSKLYSVAISHRGGDDFDYDCNCPYIDDHLEPCKHIWATLLAAEEADWIALEHLDDGVRALPHPRSRPSAPAVYRSIYSPSTSQTKAQPTPWKRALSQLKDTMRYGDASRPAPAPPAWPAGREIYYVIDAVPDPYRHDPAQTVVETHTSQPRKNGMPGKPKAATLSGWEWMTAPDPDDRLIGQMLLGAEKSNYYNDSSRRFIIPGWAHETTLKAICRTGRCLLRTAPPPAEMRAVQWDDAGPWEFFIDVKKEAQGLRASGGLRRGADERMGLEECTLATRDGLLIARDRIGRIDHRGALALMHAMRKSGPLGITRSGVGDFLKTVYALPALPSIDWPAESGVTERRVPAKPVLKLKAPAPNQGSHLYGELLFDYGDDNDDGAGAIVIPPEQPGAAIVDPRQRHVVLRDLDAERAARRRLETLGFREEWSYAGPRGRRLRVAPTHLPKIVSELTRENWRIEAEGKLYRLPGEMSVSVSSGVDWYELSGSVGYGDQNVALPKLLAALHRGENTVVLDDGSVGLLPEEWLAKYGSLAQMGQAEGTALRFSRAQTGFLDALLATMPQAPVDEVFNQARRELAEFSRVEPALPPESFRGFLRPYQQEGLGWLHFLDRFGFGGCLADDMGLGKTVQVLAMLAERVGRADAPSLVVAPRSLIFNWRQEAQRFAPHLRVLDQSGPDRQRDTAHLREYDLVLTTYGTLRSDAGLFKDYCFDYAILDEAQTIKNATTQGAKAARLLRARRRLALSGTPIENRLDDLWSLFEFLNPGMLGSAAVFRTMSNSADKAPSAANGASGDVASDNDDVAHGRKLIARALRPFILRRTKHQVAGDLPAKVEQTLHCELEPPQRKLYDELRDHYRAALLQRVAKVGMKRSKIQVLEALLRLRQAACHPGLIDKTRLDAPSAKLDALRRQLTEVLAEGHKALVFSQFTSLLSILRTDLDARGVCYEYLDGKTRDRQQRVERFHADPACSLFLISLKAGGLGLNLTGADYVFLLDPWWNPAVEAQAVDRAHRIGQSRTVFAYRLIAKGTVEEKVLELQSSKRDLANAIINEDNSLLASMGREELELLLA